MNNKSKYLAIDPGHTSGWATFDAKGSILSYGQTDMKRFMIEFDKLIHPELLAVITEDYRNHPWMKQKGWGKNETSKIIGKIEALAELRDIPVYLQPNTVKAVGYKWAGLKKAPSNHDISHQFDAVAHGIYWLQVNNIRPVGLALQKDKHEPTI